MKLSAEAWHFSSKIIQAIKDHPFNQELMKGTLPLDKFSCYIEQDSLYLQDFARCLALIASKAPLNYIRCFLRYSEDTFVTEQEVVHQFFKKIFNFQKTGLLTSATLSYTNHLFNMCSQQPIEIAISAVLPCFWVYREIGIFIAKQSTQDNPYARWIETYASEDFNTAVKKAIDIFDTLASKTTRSTQERMLDAFYKSTCLEWHFWNDAYHKTAYDAIPS